MEIKGYQQTEIGIIPTDWKVITLNNIAEKITVGIASAATHAYRDKGIPFLRNQNIRSNFLDDQDLLHISTEYEQIFKGKRLKEGDLLTARTGYPGTTCVVPKKYEQAQSFTTLITRPNNAYVESNFLCYYLNSAQGQKFFDTNQIGGGQKNVNAGTLKVMPIPLPSKKEQAIIATVLSDVDVLINSLEKLIAKKRNIKQGVMQDLLKPKDGWVSKRLGEIIRSTQLGGNYPNSERQNNYPLIKMGNIQRGEISLDKIEYIEEAVIAEKDKLSYGDVLLNTRNTLDLVGKVAVWRNELPIAYFNSNLMRMKFDSTYVASDFFMNYVFNIKSIITKLKEIATGTTSVAAIYTRDLVQLEILLPSLNDQITIATILNDMDAEIKALESKLSKYRQIKIGMMQNLLTGKIRLV